MAQGNFHRRVDADGVVWFAEPGRPRLRVALGFAVVALSGALGYWFLRPEPSREAEQVARQPQPAAAPLVVRPEPAKRGLQPGPSQPPERDPLERAMLQALQQRPLPPPEAAPSEDGAQQEVFVEQLPAGDGTGLDAFPKPGTKALKGGIIVPEGYPLPPGYLRHYQTTDDGEQLPAILMFHPDHPPQGAQVPAGRIVPRDLAPPGMPVQWLEPPPLRKGRK